MLATAMPVSAEVEFTGYSVAGPKTLVALGDTGTKASAWGAVGLTIGSENVLPLAADVVLRITPAVMSDGNMRYRNSFERRGADGRSTVLSAPTVLARPNQAFSVKVDDYEYSFDPESA